MNVTIRLKLAELGEPLDVKPAVALPGSGPSGTGMSSSNSRITRVAAGGGERKEEKDGKWREESRGELSEKTAVGWGRHSPRRVKQEA
ncbi:hypothetical protein CSUI_008514 [Cystoisospora suis]|uniref:Uncharacterized protein n=1 Tax=Cystoisospora suis TaxID=483139 RepID=A0A2C6KMD8_9APIC|nr:hypothetical protein CSUI_008514 [Cystoisospora suis]